MTGSSAALDANVTIAVMNGDAPALAWVAKLQHVYIPVPVLAELYFGALNSRRSAENQARIARMLQRAQVLDMGQATAAEWARIRLQLMRAGRPIPQNDLWIAAFCVERRVPLATFDSHFGGISGLTIVRPS
jgi:tRNA(fMet)-specific endonuclease VapC